MALDVDLDAFAAAHTDGAMVIDVREPYVYASGHLRPNGWRAREGK
jgi:hypothetical protein